MTADFAAQPVAWLYVCHTPPPRHDAIDRFVQPNRANMDSRYWTEVPLYAHHPAPALRALMTLVNEFDALGFVGGPSAEAWDEARAVIANARLSAAAPNLLAALKQIRGLATWYSAKAKGEIYARATAAIAEAEGV